MRYAIERLPESRVAIDVELEPEEVEKALERASRQLSRRHPIRGFRPGKAPRRVVEAVYGRDALYEEAAQELVAQTYHEILDRKEFEPIAEATLDRISYEPFSFRLVVPVEPTVVLCDYRSLRFPLEPEPVTEEQVDARIEELRRTQLVWKEPESPRPAAFGDRCLLDVRLRYKVGTEERREEAEDFELVLGEDETLPGLAEALVGAQVGEVREVDIVLPEDTASDALAGLKVHATVTVRAIRVPELPPLDDDWARSLGRGETLAELRARVRQEMEAQALEKAREKVAEQMLKAIVEQSTIDLPQVLVEREAKAIHDDMVEILERAGTSLERFLKSQGMGHEELWNQFLERGRDRVRQALIISEIIQAEGIQVTSEEMAQELAEEPDQGKDPKERISDVLSRLFFRKAQERLIAIALGQAPEGAAAEGPEATETAPADEAGVATAPAEA